MKTIPVHALDCRVNAIGERQARHNAMVGHSFPNGANVRLLLSNVDYIGPGARSDWALRHDLAESLAHVGSVVIEGPGPEQLADWCAWLQSVPVKLKLTPEEAMLARGEALNAAQLRLADEPVNYGQCKIPTQLGNAADELKDAA